MLDDLWTERSADTLDRVLSVLSGTLARLDQCYPARWILGETRRDDRARGATAHDDEVEFLGHLGLPRSCGTVFGPLFSCRRMVSSPGLADQAAAPSGSRISAYPQPARQANG